MSVFVYQLVYFGWKKLEGGEVVGERRGELLLLFLCILGWGWGDGEGEERGRRRRRRKGQEGKRRRGEERRGDWEDKAGKKADGLTSRNPPIREGS